MPFRRVLSALLLAALAGCAAPPPAPPPPLPPRSAAQACLDDLAAAHAAFQPLDSFGEGRCSIANPVRLAGTTVAWNHGGVLTCDMARSLVGFEAEVVQPLAHRYFGQGVRRIDHLGTFDCRARRTETTVASAGMGTSKGGRLSEHAMGRAIDLAGFQLDDGSVVSVKRDWNAAGAAGAFLHDLARASCGRFHVVLTPNHDRLHQDHIHLDIGPYSLCGV